MQINSKLDGTTTVKLTSYEKRTLRNAAALTAGLGKNLGGQLADHAIQAGADLAALVKELAAPKTESEETGD